MRWSTVSVLLVAVVSTAANADTFQGGTRMRFFNPTAGTTTTITNAGAASFGPGANSSFVSGTPTPNRLDAFGRSFDTNAENEFVVAGLDYFNGATTAGTAATTVDAEVALRFTMPPALGGNTETFTFNFQFTLTPNSTGNPVTDADILDIVGTTTQQTFVFDNTLYTLTLLGFRDLGTNQLTSSFTLPEGQTARSNLVGTITSNLLVVPTPLAAGMGLSGLLMLAAPRARRRV